MHVSRPASLRRGSTLAPPLRLSSLQKSKVLRSRTEEAEEAVEAPAEAVQLRVNYSRPRVGGRVEGQARRGEQDQDALERATVRKVAKPPSTCAQLR